MEACAVARNLRFRDESELARFLQARVANMTADQAAALAASAGIGASKKRRNKLGAQRTQVDGIAFDSIHESERYMLLRHRMDQGFISNLRCHVPFHVELKGQHICTMEVDFVYEIPIKPPKKMLRKDWAGRGQIVHEDAKGHKGGATYALFKLKKRLVEVLHGITIEEV